MSFVDCCRRVGDLSVEKLCKVLAEDCGFLVYTPTPGNGDGIVASTTQTQAGATPLSHRFNRVTSANDYDAVRLIKCGRDLDQTVRNNGSFYVRIFPHYGDAIDNEFANGPVDLQPGATVRFGGLTDKVWMT